MGERQQGFTLIETVVALAIFAAAFSALHLTFSGAWRGVRNAEGATTLVEVAKSRLAAAGIETPLEEGIQSGRTEDGFDWEINIRPYKREAEFEALQKVESFWVPVRVSGREGPLRGLRSYELTTVKLRTKT